MKIAIDGAESTGKTSLLDGLDRKAYQGYTFISEVGSKIACSLYGVSSPSDWESLFANSDRYYRFCRDILSAQQTAERNSQENYFIDSSIYRLYAYAFINGIRMDASLLKSFYYDIVFFCPIEFDPIEDGFRTTSLRAQVDSTLRSLLDEYHKGEIIYLTGSLSKRLKSINRRVLKC